VAKQDVPWGQVQTAADAIGRTEGNHGNGSPSGMLKYGQEYVDKGMEYYQQKYRDQQIKIILRKAKDLGFTATLTPATVAG